MSSSKWKDTFLLLVWPIVIFLVGMVISFLLWGQVKRINTATLQTEFDHFSMLIRNQIQKEVDIRIEHLVALRAYIDASQEVTPAEFKIFSSQILKSDHSIQALEWIPKITHVDRESFETKIRNFGFHEFGITEKGAQKQTIPASTREFYYPITYIEPFESNRTEHGFDLASNPERKSALELARDTGLMMATPKITLVHESGKSYGFLVFSPIYEQQKPQNTSFYREQNLKGFALGVYRFKDLIKQSWSNLENKANDNKYNVEDADENEDVQLFLYDISTIDQGFSPVFQSHRSLQKYISYAELTKAAMGIARYENTINLPGRVLKLVILPTPQFLKTIHIRTQIGTFIVSLSFSILSSLLALLFLQSRRRAASIARINMELDAKVLERTVALEHEVEKVVQQKRAVISLMGDVKRGKEKEEQISQELLRFNEQLKQTNQELEQFSYIASHDLQEPLRKIISFISIIEEDLGDKLNAETAENMRFVTDAANRMSNLIRDLLAFSRAGRRSLDFKQTDLNLLIQETLSVLELVIEEKKAKVTCDPMPVLNQASPLIRQVFQNLISNALKFIPDDRIPTIHISAENKGEQWLFSVKDNGIGIEKEYLESIFEVFRRLHQREEYSGTGIGLAICKKIVERHGGTIWVESTPGEGTTFFFLIPTNIDNDYESDIQNREAIV